jgi:hypothetical protein
MELAFLLYNAFCRDFEHSKLHARFITRLVKPENKEFTTRK